MGPLSRLGRVAALVGLVAVTGCPGTRKTFDTNAPGIVHLEAPPPRENGDPTLYVAPEDPGEHELYVGPAVVLGPGSGRSGNGHDTEFEAGLQVRLAYAALTSSHRSKDVPFPKSGWAMTLGWSPIQTDHRGAAGSDLVADTYVEIERYWFIASAGLGIVTYPDDWDGGIQVTLNLRPYGFRMRYLADGGFEYMAAFRLELPTAFTWSR